MAEDVSPMILQPIGVIHTPYQRQEDIPRQGRLSEEVCEIELFSQYAPGLEDIEACSHLFVIYWLHLGDRTRLTAMPPADDRVHGVFATRSPNRPNLLALDIVELVEVRGNRLSVRGMDALDGSTLLDIKPYSGEIDAIPQARIGWQKRSMRDAPEEDSRPQSAEKGAAGR